MPGALFTGLAGPCATGAGVKTSGFALGGVGGSSDGGGLDEHHKINSHGSHGGCRICRNHCCAGHFRAGVFVKGDAMDNTLRFDVIECLAGWAVYCQLKVRDDWKRYRNALESGLLVGFWRNALRSDISNLRHARRVLKEF